MGCGGVGIWFGSFLGRMLQCPCLVNLLSYFLIYEGPSWCNLNPFSHCPDHILRYIGLQLNGLERNKPEKGCVLPAVFLVTFSSSCPFFKRHIFQLLHGSKTICPPTTRNYIFPLLTRVYFSLTLFWLYFAIFNFLNCFSFQNFPLFPSPFHIFSPQIISSRDSGGSQFYTNPLSYILWKIANQTNKARLLETGHNTRHLTSVQLKKVASSHGAFRSNE